MAIISRLGVVLGLDTSEFVKGLGIADTKMKDFGSKVKVGIASAVALVGAEMIAATKQAADYADEMYKASQKIGVTTESLSALRYAADLADVEFGQLQGGLVKLSKAINDAASGKKEMAQVFKDLNVQIVDSKGKVRDTSDVLSDLSDRFQKANDNATKTATAVKLFGKSGAEMIPLLNGGAQSIRDATKEAEKFGLIVSTEAGKASEQFNDNMTRMAKATKGFQIELGNKLLPALSSTVEWMVKTIKEGRTLEAVFLGIGLAVDKLIFGADFGTELYSVNKAIESTEIALGNYQKRLRELQTTPDNWADKLFPDAKKVDIAGLENSIGEALAKITDLKHKRDQLLKKDKADADANKPPAKDDFAVANDESSKLLDKAQQQIAAYERQRLALKGVVTEARALQDEFGKGGKFEDLSKADKERLMNKAKELDLARAMADYDERRSQFMLQMRDMGIEIQRQQTERAEQQKQDVNNEVKSIEAQTRRFEYEKELVNLSDTQREKALQYFDLKEKIIKLGGDPLWKPEQIEAITTANQKMIDMEESTKRANRTFQAGWNKAWENFKERASDSAALGAEAFNSMTSSMERAMDDFVSKGKFSFSQLTASIIQDILRIQMRMQMSKIFGAIGDFFGFGGGSSAGGSTNVSSGISLAGFKLPFMATGGEIGGPAIVGEQGPELFIPSSRGTIIPNNQLSNVMGQQQQPEMVINGPYIASLNAIDTQSGLQFIARNKDAIWAANQSANRSLPMSRA